MSFSASQVSLRIDGKAILRRVDLKLSGGEILAVVGPNGAGKSSICRILSGEITPSSGQVTLNGRALRAISRRDQARLRGVLPQHSNLQFAFPVLDVVLMGRSPHSDTVFNSQDVDIARAALEQADAAHLADRLYPGLSGGERQRVHLARVLAQVWNASGETTRYLLLDEPTSALDLAHQHSTLAIARRLVREQGLGILVVLHDLNLAALYADRILMMQAGSIRCSGRPAEVLRGKIVEAVFDIAVTIERHPIQPGCPLVITTPAEH